MPENLPSRPKLGSLLERAQAITMTQLMRALTMHKSAGIRLGEYLVTYGYITDVQLTRALAEQFDLPVVDLATANIDPFYSKLIPKEYELQHEVLPISYSDGKLTVAIADPTDTKVLRHLETMTGLSLVLVLATQSAIHDAINQVFL
jgi:type IV pilus assembly protein PilB